MQEGKPISFASRSLTDAEKRYANIEREILAVTFACERFHTYVYGNPFTIHSDHMSLEMIHYKFCQQHHHRILLCIQSYDVTIK